MDRLSRKLLSPFAFLGCQRKLLRIESLPDIHVTAVSGHRRYSDIGLHHVPFRILQEPDVVLIVHYES